MLLDLVLGADRVCRMQREEMSRVLVGLLESPKSILGGSVHGM